MADVTPNRNYTRIAEDGREPAVDIAAALYQMVTDIDSDVQDVIDAQDTRDDGQDSTIATLVADLNIAEADIVDLTFGKKDLETLPSTTDLTYNGSDQLTLYEDAKYKFYNPVYTDGKLTQFDEDIKLAGTSFQVTLTYTGDLLTSIEREAL